MDAPGDLSARCGREPCAGNLVHRVAFRAQPDADEGSVQLLAVMPAARVYSTRTAAHARGFTLIEVLIALAIVGILSAIAIPSYFSYIERANRADAKATLMDATQFMQRFYSLHNSYSTQRDGRTRVALPAALQRSPRMVQRYMTFLSRARTTAIRCVPCPVTRRIRAARSRSTAWGCVPTTPGP